MELINRVLDFLEERRQNILQGNVNCIPSPFQSFRNDFVGIEQGRYYLVSAHQKSGKTQLASFLFLYTPLLYAYHHRDKIRLKIFYYPLEETKEEITLRFMSFILYTLSNHRIRISPQDLRSTDESKVLNQSVIDLLKSEEYQKILDFFEQTVVFEESTNPTGAWKDLISYAESHGTIHYKDVPYTDKVTGETKMKQAFDYYEPNDPNEYVEIIWDHVSLSGLERGMDLRQTIMKLSEYMVNLRNKYNYIPVIIQQQSDETQNLDAFKSLKIRPNVSGLADCKYTARDCNMMLGLVNPYAFELPKYLRYDVDKLRDNLRFLEVVINRNGASKGIKALFFDGAVSYFNELPAWNDRNGLAAIYNYLDKLRNPTHTVAMFAATIRQKIVKTFFS